MNAGDAADQIMRQVDKMLKINERASRDARFIKVICHSMNNLLQPQSCPFGLLVSLISLPLT